MDKKLTIIPLGSVGSVTRNMYLYEYNDEILIVDCGLGFASESMLGVDLLLPDISYLLQTKKKIVGMILTHGHEDHIGAVPFILPQLPKIPVFGTPLTAGLTNEKLKETEVKERVQKVNFNSKPLQLGSFSVSFIHVTHSVPDTAHLLIKSPAGNVYHGSDYKFDLTPADQKPPQFDLIAQAGKEGVMCLLSDCLGSEKPGVTPTEQVLVRNIEDVMRNTKGKIIFTTYSSNIARFNQAIEAAKQFNRQICFVGRSLIKATDVAKELGYMQIPKGMEVEANQLTGLPDHQVLLFVAGSQGQENSAMMRIANDDFREVKLRPEDAVVFSSDPIPGNEEAVYDLMDTIAKKGARVVASDAFGMLHVSGHGYQYDITLLMRLTHPKYLMPIGGTFRHRVAYRHLAQEAGHNADHVIIPDEVKEIIFEDGKMSYGKKIPVKNIYVDDVSGEELEHYIVRDRQRVSKEGVMVVMVQIDASDGSLLAPPDLITRGFSATNPELEKIKHKVSLELDKVLGTKKGKVTDWKYLRKLVAQTAESKIYKSLRRNPLVLPIVIEV